MTGFLGILLRVRKYYMLLCFIHAVAGEERGRILAER